MRTRDQTARATRRLLAGGALAIFVTGLGIAVAKGLDGDGSTTATIPTVVETKPKPRPAGPKPAKLVELSAAGAYDPEGDGRERDEDAALAVDGRQDTAWRTERYARFFKEGVGLVLDAGRRVRVEQVIVDSPTRGVRAEVRLGDAREGPFARAAPARTLGPTTRFAVAKRRARYIVLWVVALPPESAGEIAEVRVRAR